MNAKLRAMTLFAALAIVSPLTSAWAFVVNFDNLEANSQVGEQYSSLGLHFTQTDAGIQNGIANGDDGNWSLNGTSGPYFDGFNDPYTMTVTMDSPIFGFSLDAARSGGSNPGDTFSLMGFLGNTLVDSQSITFGEINSWSTLTLSGQMDKIEWAGNGDGFHPYGVDNLNFAAVPEPSAVSLALGAGALLFGCRRLRRRAA